METETAERNFYTTNEVLELFNGLVSRSTFCNLVKADKIPTIRFGVRKRLIPAQWVNDVLSGNITVVK